MADKKVKVLVIDDEESLCFFVKANLELGGKYEVLIATNGMKGLWSAEKDKPDVILLDIMMSGMDGFEVLKRLKSGEKTSMIPVIMLTALQDEGSKAKADDLQSDDYVVKPVAIGILKESIDAAVKGRK